MDKYTLYGQKAQSALDRAKAISRKAEEEKRDPTAEEAAAHAAALGDAKHYKALQQQVKDEAELQEYLDHSQSSDAGRGDPAAGAGPGKEHGKVTPGADPEFQSIGEAVSVFYRSRVDGMNSLTDREAAALKAAQAKARAATLNTGSSGGLLALPEVAGKEIIAYKPQQAIVRPRATVIPAGDVPDAKDSFPRIKQGALGVHGAVTAYYKKEQATLTDSTTPKFEMFDLEPEELTLYTEVSQKLLRNVPALNAFLIDEFQSAAADKEDYSFLRGSGAGLPLGFLNAANKAMIAVARNTSATVKFADIVKMIAACIDFGMAEWVISQSLMETVYGMVDAVGRSVFGSGDVSQGRPMTLMGAPINWTGKVPVAGSLGDISLIVFKYYMIKDGSGPLVAFSDDFKFNTNTTAIKVVMNHDGAPKVAEPLTLEDGATKVTPFVLLAA